MDQPTLHTARLVLRPYSLADAADLVQLAGAREVAATTLRIPHPYREHDALDFITSCRSDFQLGLSVRLAIVATAGGQLAGGVGLRIHQAHRRAELGYWLGVPFWGKGYATEAATAMVRYGFEVLALERIYASYFAGNLASQRVLEKIGMRHEGCLRRHIRKWDQFIDLEFYGMLRSELP
jgi:ribosomal-protein-alanine N-acetyltransferase